MNAGERIRELIDYYKHAHQGSRFMLTFLVLLSVVLFWCFVVYKQLVAACDFYHGQNISFEVKKARLTRIERAFKELPEKINHSEKELRPVIHKLGCDRNVSYEQALYCFKKHHITVKACKREKKEEVAALALESYIISVFGTFEALVACMHTLEALYPSLTCESCEIKKADGGCIAVFNIRCITNRGENTLGKKAKKQRKACADC